MKRNRQTGCVRDQSLFSPKGGGGFQRGRRGLHTLSTECKGGNLENWSLINCQSGRGSSESYRGSGTQNSSSPSSPFPFLHIKLHPGSINRDSGHSPSMDTHDQTTQQPVDEDLWGYTSNSRNNDENRNAPIQAYQRATIDLIAWWRLAVLQSKRRDLHQKWLYRETNEQSLSPTVSFSLDIHRFVIYHAIESSLTDG